MKKFVLALMLLSTPAAAQQCVHPAMVVTQATNAVPHAVPTTVLTGAKKDQVLAAYNKTEPVSDYAVDGIVVITAKDVPVAFLVGFVGVCTVFADTFPLEDLIPLLDGGV